MLRHNPYYYHPQPAARLAADDVLSAIAARSEWAELFAQGKMLGVLVVENKCVSETCFDSSDSGVCTANHDSVADISNYNSRVHIINNVCYLAAYSGVVNGLQDERCYFVPPIYDLQQPDDFYLTKDAEITAINQRLKELDPKCNEAKELQQKRHSLSIALQKEIFSHFNLVDSSGQHYKNIVDIFADAKRGLPPGGTGECSAPRLLHYAFEHGLKPLYLAEFWVGAAPRNFVRVHGAFYPSCIEKCSPLLHYQLGAQDVAEANALCSAEGIRILYEDSFIIVLSKPAGLLSVAAKDLSLPNVEDTLHKMYPEVKGPMLIHRLDQATSGLLVAAKDATTHKSLQLQFQQRDVHKKYVALLKGRLSSVCGCVDLPMTVNPDDRPRQVVDFQFGKKATTFYRVLSQEQDTSGALSGSRDITRVELFPMTGRTHQLRVHCASTFGLDMPILGDLLYDIIDDNRANNTEKRLYLHAEEISFEHPETKKRCRFVDSAPF